jgi:pyridoxamine 5'-phosphate oxidase
MTEIALEKELDPLAWFLAWMKDAEAQEPNDPNAVALATASGDGMPDVRMVLMKRADERGFAFYTNSESRKGVQLAENPRAAMCFHWKSLRRQVRLSGSVVELPEAEADRYFHSRSRLSQLGAAASQQSRPIASRELLIAQVEELDAEFPGEIPRPAYWKGYLLKPTRIEFWKNGEGRLHDRFLFTRDLEGWRKQRLFP